MENRIKNIAIMAHIDAGKTTLSERILFLGRTISAMGEVDEGLATLDYLQEEKKRGITIEAGWSHFNWKDYRINLIDTPGHIDFGSEVDCVLDAIEGAVLVVSSVRGVQTQTIANWRKLKQVKMPCLVFLNKTEMDGLSLDDLLLEVEEYLEIPPLLLSYPIEMEQGFGIVDILAGKILFKKNKDTRDVDVLPLNEEQQLERLGYYKELVELASDFSEEVLGCLLEEKEPPMAALYEALQNALLAGRFLPTYAGSARLNVGVRSLMNGIRYLLPSIENFVEQDGLMGRIVNVRHHEGMGKLFLMKVLSLISNVPEGLKFYSVNADSFIERGVPCPGDVCAVATEKPWKMGDLISTDGSVFKSLGKKAYDSLMHFRVGPKYVEDADTLQEALAFFAETEPGMSLRYDSNEGNWDVGVVGEVFFEVLVERLESEFKVQVESGEPRVEKREWLKPGEYFAENEMHAEGCSLFAKIKVRPSSTPGIKAQVSKDGSFEEITELHLAILHSSLREFAEMGLTGEGHLLGVKVLLEEYRCAGVFLPGLFKKLISYLLTQALSKENVILEEPYVQMNLSIPEEFSSVVLADINQRSGVIKDFNSDGKLENIRIEIPLAKTFGYTTDLRSITKGRGAFDLAYIGHKSVL